MTWLRLWLQAFVEALRGYEPERLQLQPVLEDGPVPGWFAETWSRPEWVRCHGCGELQMAISVALDACPACTGVKR